MDVGNILGFSVLIFFEKVELKKHPAIPGILEFDLIFSFFNSRF